EDDANDEDEKEDDDDEEEEHLTLVDCSIVPIDDLVPSAENAEAFETYGSTPTPPPLRLRRARISVRPLTPMSASAEALI
ncbi:hypothetical protein Tco_1494810, partial [Tanacetum coccineum]